MSDLPSSVLTQLLKRVTIPDDLARLIYWLMVQEVENGYPALNRSQYAVQVTNDEPFLIPYTLAILSVLSKLPKVKDDGLFRAPVHELAGVTLEHAYSLLQLRETGFHQYSKADLDVHTRKYEDDYIKRFARGMWRDLLNFNVSFGVPEIARYSHTHVLAPSGMGKTTLLEYLTSQDVQTDAAVIVMTLKGELLPSIARLKAVDPDRLVLVRPQDTAHPLALNVFDLKGDTNNVVGLLNYTFGSILETAISPKQTVLLNYCIRLLLVAGGTIKTLRDLMKSDTLPDRFLPHVSQLSPAGQEFFKDEFGHKKQYGETKENLVWRLDLLLENETIAAMFSQSRNLFSMADVFEQGKVLLIDTNVKTLGEMGSAFLGRFFISLVQLAGQQRDTSTNLRPVWFYIDEASSYFTNTIELILERMREARVGITLSHQQLGQFKDPTLEDSVRTNTAIKYVGKLQSKDSIVMAKEMQIEPERLMKQKQYDFALHVRGVLDHPLTVRVPHYSLEKRTDEEMRHVVEQNRARYTVGKEPHQEKVDPPHTEPPDDIEQYNKA